jgi:hypothetical protein
MSAACNMASDGVAMANPTAHFGTEGSRRRISAIRSNIDAIFNNLYREM